MRPVVCPYCQGRNQLPDPWPAGGYTCTHCRMAVSLLQSAPLADPFAGMEDDEPILRPRHHSRRRGDLGRAMADGFGWTVGEQLAKMIFGLFACAIAIAFGAFWLIWAGRIRF